MTEGWTPLDDHADGCPGGVVNDEGRFVAYRYLVVAYQSGLSASTVAASYGVDLLDVDRAIRCELETLKLK